ncbi:GNAT family N-acetyltransferase [Planctomonas sp. JC2975]|uniref:GNAT family N-acetyltransferase n=1 Tax=Planctomonas sp. JC2975 TaxID=2729626 RepID=UPI0014742D6B|nr:GNAT family N-acetyltransferase [Planctomonas sp. JC2975]NNC12321.1 GNAT family N-acetyltransferase [Planctomonas sp. JC2975]
MSIEQTIGAASDREATSTPPGTRWAYVLQSDPLARPMIDDLTNEYDSRYGFLGGEPASVELARYPDAAFAPPHGAFLLLLADGQEHSGGPGAHGAIAGGAFKRLDDETAEFKRIWTHADHRRKGLSRLVLAELEAEAVLRGYRRVYLTTGPRQPEAQRLYLNTGYTPLYDLTKPADEVGLHAFEKALPARP